MVSFRDSVDLLSLLSSNDAIIGGSSWAGNAVPNGTGGVSNVALNVLESFNIPIQGSVPTGSKTGLPGYDINNSDAISALKIGLASYLADEKFVDVFVNGDGFAEFVVVAETGGFSPNTPLSLNVRSCLPTYTFEEKANVVIVSGYDPPPERIIRPKKDIIGVSQGPTNGGPKPQVVADSDSYILLDSVVYGDTADRQSCDNSAFETVATVSYKDPVLDSAYDDQSARNGTAFYNLQAFESLAGYVIDFDTGDGNTDLHVSYQQSGTTIVKYTKPVTIPTGNETVCAILSDGSGSENATFKTAKISIDRVTTRDRYGIEDRDILLGIEALEARGNTIQSFTTFESNMWLYVDDRILRLSISEGKNWNWSFDDSSSGATINLFTPVKDGDDYIWDALTSDADYTKYVVPFRGSDVYSPAVSDVPSTYNSINTVASAWPYLGTGLGTYIYDMVVTVAIERPSIIISDPHGNALQKAQDLRIAYYPIIMKDEPAPVAFVIGGSDTGLVDHSLDIYDNDPTTVQPDPVTVRPSASWLQSQKTGQTLEVSLPFLEEDDCLPVARYLYDMYDNFGSTDSTFSLVCGPDDEPKLGYAVDGFDARLRVNEITHSYQDGSSYNINVSLGPVFTSMGSWNTSVWQKKTEDVSREGTITFCQGNGFLYRVRVPTLGEYWALNASPTGNYGVGERVSIKIYNNPVEK
jgi:hypothetical protein